EPTHIACDRQQRHRRQCELALEEFDPSMPRVPTTDQIPQEPTHIDSSAIAGNVSWLLRNLIGGWYAWHRRRQLGKGSSRETFWEGRYFQSRGNCRSHNVSV